MGLLPSVSWFVTARNRTVKTSSACFGLVAARSAGDLIPHQFAEQLWPARAQHVVSQ